ncbi:GDP-mannose 4,6-dehydratase [Candidatus Pelagibacter sp.]|jgi:GDPmannose 4,6-dehydratase|nr:GDP-mannose 4,6-dehydratase [Candidatus Pelagibacter sp.]
MKKILILGVTGQDGSYMADFLLNKKISVHGVIRKSSTGNTKNIDHIINNSKIFNKSFFLHKGDLLDAISISNIINKVKPDEIYNFADQDHVTWSRDIPLYSYSTTTLAVIQIFEFLKTQNKKIKFFQPVSSNMFGATKENSLNENSNLSPRSVYALGKSSTYLASKMYSNVNNLFICGAIFFNHESPRRSQEYVTTKIIKAVCNIYLGKQKYLHLGDISAKIDWGYAKDYVEMAWKIMQQKKPDFFVIGTGVNTSVEKFADECFKFVGLNYKEYLKVDRKLLRTNKTKNLKANLKKAKKVLNYKVKTNIKNLIKIMMENELKQHNG